jgi:hypothetical protein
LHQGGIQTNGFTCVITYPVPVGEVSTQSLSDPQSVFKVTPGGPTGIGGESSTFSFTLPGQYMYDFDTYRYLIFKVYLTAL